jgi:hypothetical protein
MSSMPISVEFDGRQCLASCSFLAGTCKLWHSKIKDRELYGGQTEVLRCKECIDAFGVE